METLASYLTKPKEPSFSPSPYYDSDGDCLSFLFKNDDYYGQRVDQILTVYRSFTSNEIVGCQIKGVRCILKKLGDFGIRIQDKQVDLSLIFLAYVAKERPTEDGVVEELSREASRFNARIPAEELVLA